MNGKGKQIPFCFFSAARLMALLCLALAAWTAQAASVAVELSPADAEAKWGPSLKEDAEQALGQAESRLGLKLDRPVEILSQPDTLEFEAYLGAQLPRVVAVARAERCQIVINRRAMFAEGRPRQRQVLVHEMAHLLLGRNIKGRMPAWLDEGLAMMTAGEGDFDSHWRVLVSGTLDTLIPLQLLMDRVTIGVGNQDQAYAQSLSLTRFFIRRECPGESGNDPAPLIKYLTDPERGENRVKRLWDPIAVAALDYQWRHSWHTIWAALVFLSGSTFVWMFISFLFLAAWWRKRRMARAIRERFQSEEQMDSEYGGEEYPYWLEENSDTDEFEEEETTDSDREEKRKY
jgi:hypothetical protein